jgi:hypothetical protein
MRPPSVVGNVVGGLAGLVSVFALGMLTILAALIVIG